MTGARQWVSAALAVVSSTALLALLWMVFGPPGVETAAELNVPIERSMGMVQRIFYLHAPAGMVSYLAFAMVGVFSVGYLIRRGLVWDNLARASAEVGLVFSSIVLVTGPIWARPAWGRWWTWEARLTLTLVLWLIFVAYLMVRDQASDRSQSARLSAVIGIVGAVMVPLAYASVHLWRGHHPIVFGGGEDSGLADPAMGQAFLLGLVCALALWGTFVSIRYRIGTIEDELERIEHATREASR